MPRQYNVIFSKLTGNDSTNVLGLIAYSIYKEDKIKFIEAWQSENPGKEGPGNTELNEFHKHSLRSIDNYRKLAETQMTAFMNDLVSERVEIFKQAEKDAQKEVWDELIQAQKVGVDTVITACQKEASRLNTTWKTYAWSGIIGNTAFLVFLAGLFFILGLFGNDLAGRVIAWVREASNFAPR